MLPTSVKEALARGIMLLQEEGPNLSRPYCDTLYNSNHSNMKELRLKANTGVWRLCFAFDPQRKAILLVAGNKKGKNQKRFYDTLISTADNRYTEYLDSLKL